jgi:hypothetical protein
MIALAPSVAQVDAWSSPDFAGLRWAGFLLKNLMVHEPHRAVRIDDGCNRRSWLR